MSAMTAHATPLPASLPLGRSDSFLDRQAVALRAYHRLLCQGHATEPGLAAAQGERNVLAAFRGPRRAVEAALRAHNLVTARAA